MDRVEMQVIKAIDNVHSGSYIGPEGTCLGARTPFVQFIDDTKLFPSINMMHIIKINSTMQAAAAIDAWAG